MDKQKNKKGISCNWRKVAGRRRKESGLKM